VPLERALTLAQREGHTTVFVSEGQPMVALLEAAARHGVTPTQARRLLAVFDKAKQPALRGAPESILFEPLSEREREVLRLLETDLSGPEIARQLVVSLNTVRTHTKNIYAKLGVNNRRAAVRRAGELGQLARETHQRS
jgi:LuxR family transcriptional regulator, maltose regulon positive regulatory protein